MSFGTSTKLYSLLAERIYVPIYKEKRLDNIYIKPIASLMCVITDIDTNCVHLLKNAYSLFKIRTAELFCFIVIILCYCKCYLLSTTSCVLDSSYCLDCIG